MTSTRRTGKTGLTALKTSREKSPLTMPEMIPFMSASDPIFEIIEEMMLRISWAWERFARVSVKHVTVRSTLFPSFVVTGTWQTG